MPKEYIECEAAIEAAKHAWALGIGVRRWSDD